LGYFTPTVQTVLSIAHEIDLFKRESIDFWLRDVDGIWHAPGDFTAPYAIQMTPVGCYFVLNLVLPVGTNYPQGAAYSLVITFRSG
jgi:hypothetical protein